MLKNPYLKNLSKIEFVVTDACTGSCKHCSQGTHGRKGSAIDPALAVSAVTAICAHYPIKTLLTFGGEPLLAPTEVCAIQAAGRAAGIPHRQVITNGFVTRDTAEMRRILSDLRTSGVNDLRLSVDAFHQETIPLDKVKAFATEAKKFGVPIRLQPAWLVDCAHDNPYNRKTREILDSFSCLGIIENEGNIIFPEGNALKNLSEYFKFGVVENPYVEDACDVRCVSFSPNGDVLGENAYRRDIMDILKDYAP